MGEDKDTPAEPKGYAKTVVAGNERLRFRAVPAKQGFNFYVQKRELVDKKMKTVSRGASETFATLAEASAQVDKGVAAALEQGWALPARTGAAAFTKKADAFSLSSLPKPKAPAATATAEAAPAAAAPAPAAPAPAAPAAKKEKAAAAKA